MSFLDEVRAGSQKPGTVCTVRAWLETQTDITDAELRQAASTVTVAAAYRAMIARGFEFKRQTVERHMRGECSCPTS